jgi:D-alanyl-D-alanine carboxypeptidase
MSAPRRRRVEPGVVLAVLAGLLTGCGAPAQAPAESGTPAAVPATASDAAPGLPAPAQHTPPGGAPAPPADSAPPQEAAPAKEAAPSAAEPPAGAHSDPSSPGVVVNKRRPLSPRDFAPPELVVPKVPLAVAAERARLRPDAARALEEMFAAAEADGVGLTLVSGYRSYAEQESTYTHWVGQYGDPAQADTVSARAGYSEHQTGLAFDVGQADGACTLVLCFRDTPAAQWAADHAAGYGFILRYPLGFHGITGFSAESWHFRYVGTEISGAMEAAGTATLEEHFGLPAAPGY